jgi:hypothetical protein
MTRSHAVAVAVGLVAALGPIASRALAQPHPSFAPEIAPGDVLADPPRLDGPPLRTSGIATQVYTDYTYLQSTDIGALSAVSGEAQNHRFALGARVKLRDFELELEVPFLNVTKAQFERNDPLLNMAQDKTAVSFGDVRLGVAYVREVPYYPPKMFVGAALRSRLPTHTTKFNINTAIGPVSYKYPPIVQLEPALLFATAFGPISFTTTQGALVMLGNDVDIGLFTQKYPNLVFYDAHFTGGFALLGKGAVTLDLAVDWQLNTVTDPPPPDQGFADTLNDIHAFTLAPGFQWYFDAYKVDVGARIGLGEGAKKLGVLTFAGDRSVLLRLTRAFDWDASSLFGGS